MKVVNNNENARKITPKNGEGSSIEKSPSQIEDSPLLRHLSMGDYFDENEYKRRERRQNFLQRGLPLLGMLLGVMGIIFAVTSKEVPTPLAPSPSEPHTTIQIRDANEHMLDIGGGLSLWYRTWGNRASGIPVLFVHGGPGNAISDYGHTNANFFPAEKYFVVEVDQRGTGRSQPSVRDDCRNSQYYTDISIDKMSHDFELLREELGFEKWLVFGGSWGSTLSLDYGTRYSERCLGLILRGIYLNTVPEFDDVLSRAPYLNNKKRLREFDTWFEMAAREVKNSGEPPLDPNDSERFFRVYERMIERCDRNADSAIWHWHVFETNLMEEDPKKLLDPTKIVLEKLPEATSVAFFESRLFLHGTFEDPVNLLERVDRLKHTPTWVCQGHRDEVCPEQYAKKLVNALEEAGVPTKPKFIDAGHEATDPVMAKCLRKALDEFAKTVYN